MLPFYSEPKHRRVTLDRSLTYHQHLEPLHKKQISRVSLQRRLAGSAWGAGATTLESATLVLVHSTAEYCAPVWCRIAHTSPSILPSTTPCELWLDACILHQWLTSKSSQASNLLSFVAMEPQCPKHAVPWSLDTCFAQRSPVRRVHALHLQMYGASNRDTHLYPPHNNSSVHLTTTTCVQCTGRITNGMRSGRTITQESTFPSPKLVPFPRGDPASEKPWSGLTTSTLISGISAPAFTSRVCSPLKPMSVA